MTTAYVNKISTAVPTNEVHQLLCDNLLEVTQLKRHRLLLEKVIPQCQISSRYSVLDQPSEFYGSDPDAVSTAARMAAYKEAAPDLAARAVAGLDIDDIAADITHIVVITCTGFFSPGLDLELIKRFGINPNAERTTVGFMGCFAGVNGLKFANHIVRSEPNAKVLVLSLELCSLHLQMPKNLEMSISSLLFADGCAAALITSEEQGIGLDSFTALVVPDTHDQMSWHIGDTGFDMVLSRRVPGALKDALNAENTKIILNGAQTDSIDLWAVHPGGRLILDSVEEALELGSTDLRYSRDILDRFGNMSSATIFFVLQQMMNASDGANSGKRGCGMAFGPGLTAETLLFHIA